MSMLDADLELLQRYTEAGDAEAFAQIVHRHRDMVFGTAVRVLGDRTRAEDVAQEAFGKLMRHPEGVSRSVAAWLHRVTTRLAIDAMRRDTARARRERAHALTQQRQRSEVADDWQAVSNEVDAALARLDTSDRHLLVQHFLEGRSQRQLAGEMGVSKATLCRRMRAALDALRRELGRRGVVTSVAAIGGTLVAVNSASGAAPPALTSELGKMAMVGGTGVDSAAGMSLSAKITAATASLGVAGAVAIGTLIYFMPDPTLPPEAVRQRNAAIEQALQPIAPVETTPGPVAQTLEPGTLIIEADGNTLDSRRVSLVHIHDPDTILLVFGDNHTETVTSDEADTRLRDQTDEGLQHHAQHAPRLELEP